MSDHRKSQKMDDCFLLNHDDAEIRIAAEFLSNWLPFLSRGLCKSCTRTLSDGIRSLHTEGNFAASTPNVLHLNECKEDQGNCSAHSTGSKKDSADNNDCADTHSLGSWKDDAGGMLEHAVEASPTSETFSSSAPIASPLLKKSWADMALEDELAEEENEVSSRLIDVNDSSADGTFMNEAKVKVALSRDQREYIRFNSVQRKKDFICLQRINGKLVNILDGLELHKGVFSAAEQKRIVGYVEQLQEMGRNGQLKDVSKCPRTTTEIANEMHQAIMSNKRNKPIQFDDEVEEIQSSNIPNKSSDPSNDSSSNVPSSVTASKRMKSAFQFPTQITNKKIETHLRKSPEEVVDERHRKGSSQTTLENRLRSPEEKDKVHMHIANWFYENGIPFNAANSRSFEVMIESIGQYGPGLKPPSYHELRVPLLKKAKANTEELKEKHKSSWKQYGCTLMSDGWTDRRGRHLINFLVNSPAGTYFMGSVDASSQTQDASMLAELLDGKIKEIGAEYVVQVVTDNASNYKAAGHILMERRPTLFWTPCAAHCLDLMLEDIGNLKQFKPTIWRARRITTFIYRHGRLLDAMRTKTDGRDLVRSGVTRFATSFLTLKSLCKHKDSLRQLFISDDWTCSKLSTTEAGKKVYDTVISSSFWHSVEDCIRASQPLLVVLRIVDSDERPPMPEILAAMEFAKKKIKDAFNNKQRLYKKVIDIIERRWECQMEQKLYGVALFLNPGKYFDIKEDEESGLAYKLRRNFNDVLSKMVPDQVLADKISDLADAYESSRGDFSKDMSIRQRKTKNPMLTYSAPLKWMRGKGRVTLQFGCCYNYATDKNGNPPGILRNEMVDPLPHLFKVMIKRLVRWCVLPPSCVPDSCIVNIYEEGDCIPPHIDNHDFVRPFCTVSFLSECEILFGSNLKIVGAGDFAGSYAIPLPVGSVLVINGNGADVAKHCVPAVPSKRISITFRTMDESKRPSGYVPEPDLQGLEPLLDDADRWKKYNSGASRDSRFMRKPAVGREDTRVDRGRGLTAKNPDSRYSGRVLQGLLNRRRLQVNYLENS